MPKSSNENFSISIDPRLMKFVELIAHKKFSSKSKIIEDALRLYIKFYRMQQEDTPEWWDKCYQETFEESN